LFLRFFSKTEPEWAKELEEDVKEEAEKNGPVVHIHVEQDSPVCSHHRHFAFPCFESDP